ncbi:DUF3540 domain-containing protein [Paraburkholderia sediminicola]|uniref:DUF3540 domain-containing protein n=1 Tax=Paraburkholderia sediminicola TaxID=458836 RepID=UPI0038BACA1B
MNHRNDMKSTVAELRTPTPTVAGETLGIVLAILPEDMLLVECGGARLPCRRAFSCLIAPEAGDRVVVNHGDRQHSYVLAILERTAVGNARIRIDGDLLLESTHSVHVRAAQQIHLHSESELQLRSGRLELVANEAELVAEKTAFHCTELHGRAGALRLIGKTLETVVERIVQISKTSFRTIEAVDHVRAAHIDYAATESARLHGKHTLLTAERLAKIDAQQIHLG